MKKRGTQRQPAKDTHGLACPPAGCTGHAQPGRARSCPWCSAGRFGSQTSREIGCVKHANDQIQPTASNLRSQSLGFRVFGPRCRPGASNIWAPPNASSPWGCCLEVRGLAKSLTLRRCPGGRGHSSYQPSHLLGAQTRSPRPSTGQRQPRHLRASRWQDGLDVRGTWTWSSRAGDPLRTSFPHWAARLLYPLWPFLCLSSCLLLPVARTDYLEAPGRGLLVVVKGSKPGALDTTMDDQRVLNRAPLRLLVFRFQFLLAVGGGSVENQTCSY